MSLVLIILGGDPRSWFLASMRQVYISGSEIGVTLEYVLLNWIIYQPHGPGIGFTTQDWFLASMWQVYYNLILNDIETDVTLVWAWYYLRSLPCIRLVPTGGGWCWSYKAGIVSCHINLVPRVAYIVLHRPDYIPCAAVSCIPYQHWF
jgi:hypothetical protein